MARLRQVHGSTPARRPAARAKAIDVPTHKALATALAKIVANANVNHWDAANEAARHLVHILKVHGIDPSSR